MTLIAGAALAADPLAPAARVPVPVTPAAEYFPLSDLRLLDGPFRRAMELDQRYLLSLDPDRLLVGFRRNAGLPENAKAYGGWESRGLAGQTLGHYLSACAHMWASTGDRRFLDKLDYCVDALAACQAKAADGFVGGMPHGPAMFADIAAGSVHAKGGFDLNGGWVPWYNQHKLFAGLIDASRLAGSDKAKAVLIKLGDWAGGVVANLDERQVQGMLATEHGGMMEALADLYAITGDAKFLALAERFWHKAVLDPLAQGHDDLTGKHANTNIPKVIGAARLYELTGDPKYKTVADTFWTTVTEHRSFVTGSNSDHEHFFDPGLEAGKLGPENGETCNVYNMLKLTSHLASWGDASGPSLVETAGEYDYYERALFNHILGSIDPDTGTCTYFQSLEPGRFKVYASPEDSFWCCTGTGLENHAKYPEHVYAHTADTLRVNLFMASELTWKEKGLVLRQETQFPAEDTTTLTVHVEKPTALKLQVRVPGWAGEGIRVDGAVRATAAAGSGYLTIDRTWNDGDTLVVRLPMKLRLHRAVDDATMVAFLYGPVVLAGELGRWDFPAADAVPSQTQFDNSPLPDVPVLVTADDTLSWLKPVAGKPLHFTTGDVGRPGSVELSPVADIHHQRYAAYFRMLSEPQYADRQKKIDTDRAVARALAARTVDEVNFGEQQSEQDHAVKSDKSTVGGFNGKTWRDARDGGSFSAGVKVKPGVTQVLRCTYWGSDAGRDFDVIADGKVLATESLTAAHHDQFFDVEYPLPAPAAGRDAVRVEFRAHPGSIAGGVFGCRVLTRP